MNFDIKYNKSEIPLAPFAVAMSPVFNTGINQGFGTKLIESPIIDKTSFGGRNRFSNNSFIQFRASNVANL